MKTKQSSTKRALFASGLSILLCLLMLIGTTLAWFTDTVNNKGNIIQAGNLRLAVLEYDEAGTILRDLKTDLDPLVNESGFYPSKSGTKYIGVSNTGSLDLEFKLTFTSEDSKLSEVISYTFVEINAPGSVGTDIGTPSTGQMNNLDVNVKEELASGDVKYYKLTYRMNNGAGNTYQALALIADLNVVATQTEAMSDNKTFDEKVKYISNAADLAAAVGDTANKDYTLVLMGNMNIAGDLLITVPMNLELNGYNIYVTGTFGADVLAGSEGGTVDIGRAPNGNGNVYTPNAIKEDYVGGVVNNYVTAKKAPKIENKMFGSNQINAAGTNMNNFGYVSFTLSEDFDVSLTSGNKIELYHEYRIGDTPWIAVKAVSANGPKSTLWDGIFVNESDGNKKYPKHGNAAYESDILPAGAVLSTNETNLAARYSEIFNAIKNPLGWIEVRTVVVINDVQKETFGTMRFVGGGYLDFPAPGISPGHPCP